MRNKNDEKFLLYLRVMEHTQLDPTQLISVKDLKDRADDALAKFRKKYPNEAGHPEVLKEEQYVVVSHIFAKLITDDELKRLKKIAAAALKDGVITKRESNKEWILDEEFSEKDYLDYINKK